MLVKGVLNHIRAGEIVVIGHNLECAMRYCGGRQFSYLRLSNPSTFAMIYSTVKQNNYIGFVHI